MDDQAAIHQLRPVKRQELGRQADGALETAVGDFETMDGRGARRDRKPALARDPEDAAVDRDIEIIRLDAGQSRDDTEFIFRFEDIDWRLPAARPPSRLEESPLDLLGPRDDRQGLIPHDAARI